MVCVFIAWFINAHCPRCFWPSQVSPQAWKASVCRQAQTGAPSLWDLMLDDLRWSWCNNNRYKVHTKCNAFESSWNHLHLVHGKNCLQWNGSLVPKRLGTTSLRHRCTASHSASKTSFQGEGGSLMKWNGEEAWEWDLSPDWSITIYQACSWAPTITPSLSLF